MKNPITLKRKRKVITKGIFELAASIVGDYYVNTTYTTCKQFKINSLKKTIKPKVSYAVKQAEKLFKPSYQGGVITINGKACGYMSQQHGLVVV